MSARSSASAAVGAMRRERLLYSALPPFDRRKKSGQATPSDCLLTSATHPFDPELPDYVCKHYVSLLILKLPLGEE